MKAISIKEPWASMILAGEKTIETRTWRTKYRGPLLLCASKKPESDISGHAFAIVDLVGIRKMTMEDEAHACCKVYSNAKSWFFENLRKIKPFPVKGQLRIFEVDIESNLDVKLIRELLLKHDPSFIDIESMTDSELEKIKNPG